MEFATTYRKRKPVKQGKLQPAALIKCRLEDSLAVSSGTASIKSRDPVYHITESFKSTFDMCGQYNANKLAAEYGIAGSGIESQSHMKKNGKQEGTISGSKDMRNRRSGMDFSGGFPEYENTQEEKAKGNFYRKFSDIAFTNGYLASAVLQNGGKTMFVSCIKRALGHSWPYNSKQSKLFSATSSENGITNSSAKVVFNNYTKSAVGLVVESIHSARQTLEFFERMAEEGSPGGNEEGALRTLYPFLSISPDKEKLAEYEARLKELNVMEQAGGKIKEHTDISTEKAILTAGIVKTQALITKKRQMKEQFLNNLMQLLENSRKAEAVFTESGLFSGGLEELQDIEERPEDNGGDEGNDNSRKRKKKKRLLKKQKTNLKRSIYHYKE